MLIVKNATKNYRDFVVFKNISFTLERGRCLGIVGKNGAGKSTLIDCILNPEKLTNGKIQYETTLDIGVQFQEAQFDTQLKVKEVCDLFCALHGVENSIAHGYLKTFELENKQNQYTNKLSGGERQKLNILCSLLHNPDLIIFDELTTGLDTLTRKEMYKTLKKLKSEGKTIILITHYYEELDNLADKVLYLNKSVGKLLTPDSEKDINELLNEVMINE